MLAAVLGVADQPPVCGIDDEIARLQRNLTDQDRAFIRDFGHIKGAIAAPEDRQPDCPINIQRNNPCLSPG